MSRDLGKILLFTYKFRSEAVYDEFVVMGFKRKVNTGDGSDDFLIQLGNHTDLIWAYGEVNTTTGDLEKHYGYGITSMVMPTSAVYLLNSMYSVILAVSMAIYLVL